MTRGILITLVSLVTTLTSSTSFADEADEVKPEIKSPVSNIQLETTAVTGSRELPKVLVIVPWKSPQAIGPGGRPLASLVEEVLSPLDPDVFRRELNYYTELKTADAKSKQDNATASEN